MLQEKLKSNKKINIIWDTIVEKANGEENPKSLNSITIKNKKVVK